MRAALRIVYDLLKCFMFKSNMKKNSWFYMGRIISKMGLIMEEVGDNKIIIQFYFVNFADCKVCYLNMF